MLPVDMLKAAARNKNLLKPYDDMMERFRGLVTDPLRPVRVILAG